MRHKTAKDQQLPSNLKGGQYPISKGSEAHYDVICDQLLPLPEQTTNPASSAVTCTTLTPAPTKVAKNAQDVKYEYVCDMKPENRKNRTLDGKATRERPLEVNVSELQYDLPSSVRREWPPKFSVPEASYEVPLLSQPGAKHKTNVHKTTV